ncbi:MAG: hypothetical protein V3V96_14475 [Acidiferrobacterales bacterium]
MAEEPQGAGRGSARLVFDPWAGLRDFNIAELLFGFSLFNQDFRRLMSSPAGAAFNAIITGNANRADFEETRQAVEESTLQGTAIVNEILLPAIDRAQELGDEAVGISQDFFEPGGTAERFREVFDPITGELEGLSGEVAAGNEAVQALLAETRGEFEEGAADVLGGFAELRGDLRAGAAEITGGFEESLDRARGLVSGLGEAERQDINRRFTEAGREAEASLRERGFGGTLAAGARIGAERGRSTALLGLEEQIAGQQLGVEETFGLAGLSAQERLFAAGINLDFQALGAQERLAGAGAQLGVTQAGAQQFGNQLFANTALDALAQRATVGFGQTGAFDQAALAQIQSLLASGSLGFGAAAQGTDLATSFFPNVQIAPTPTQVQNPFSFVS